MSGDRLDSRAQKESKEALVNPVQISPDPATQDLQVVPEQPELKDLWDPMVCKVIALTFYHCVYNLPPITKAQHKTNRNPSEQKQLIYIYFKLNNLQVI